VAAWVKTEAPWYSGTVVSKPKTGPWVPPYNSYSLYLNTDQAGSAGLSMYLGYGGGTTYTAAFGGTGTWDVNEWAHMAGTYDGNVVRSFINGVEVGSVLVQGGITQVGGDLFFGLQRPDVDLSRPQYPWEKFKGAMDEVRLYDRALGECEIKELAGTPCVPPDTTPPVIVPTVTGTLGGAGWYTSDVTVSWDVTDPDSDVTATGCDEVTISTDTAGVDITCQASSEGGDASETVSLKRDATPPVIQFSGNAGTYAADATLAITCTAGDILSGLDSVTCPEANAETSFTIEAPPDPGPDPGKSKSKKSKSGKSKSASAKSDSKSKSQKGKKRSRGRRR